MATMDDFKNAYLGLEKGTAEIEKLNILSPLELEKLVLSLERANKEKDPQAKSEAMYKLFGQVKQDLGFYIGKDVKGMGAALANVQMDRDAKFQSYVSTGVKALEEVLH